MTTEPWKRQQEPEPIPEPIGRGVLAMMDTGQFERLIRDNLQPVNNDPERWQSLWRLLTRDNDLAERANEALAALEEQAKCERDHLPDLTDVQRKRIKKFLRNIETCWNKLEDDGQQRLAWAGAAGRFTKQDQITIQVLVMAIDRHRAATAAAGPAEVIDAELWDGLDRSGAMLTDDESRSGGSRRRGTAGEKVTEELVAAICEHADTPMSQDGFDERNQILWSALRRVDLDPADHYVRRREEQRNEKDRR